MAQNNKYKPAEDISNLWRFAYVETWSPVYNDYIRQNEQTNIKPRQSIKAIEVELSKEYGVNVRLYVPKSMR